MFNVFDIVILVIVAGSAVGGFREGLVRGVIKLVGMVIVLIAMSVFAGTITSLAERLTLFPPEIMVPLTFILLFAIAMAALHFLAEFLHKLIHMTPAGFVDSGLGTAFGVLKALLLGGLLALLLSYAPRGGFLNRQYVESHTAGPLRSFLAETIPFVVNAGRSIYDRYQDIPVPNRNNDEHEDNQYSI